MPPNGPRLAKQHDSQRHETQKRAEKHPADVQPSCACRDDGPQHQQPDRKREIVTPLTRRYPCSGNEGDRQDDAEIGGVVQVLAVDAQHELRRHRKHRRQRVRPQGVTAQQQRQSAAGYDRRQKSALLEAESLEPEGLRRQPGSESQSHLQRMQRKVTQQDARSQQQREKQDLEDSRVFRQECARSAYQAAARERHFHSRSHHRVPGAAAMLILARIWFKSQPVRLASVCASRSCRFATSSK